MRLSAAIAVLSMVAVIVACIAPTSQAGMQASYEVREYRTSYGSNGGHAALREGYGSSGVSLRAGYGSSGTEGFAATYGSHGGYAEVAMGYGSDGGVSRREARLSRKAARHARKAGTYAARAGAVRASYGVSYGASYSGYGYSGPIVYSGRRGPCPGGVCP